MRERIEKSKINIDIAKWFCFDAKINGLNILEIRLYYHYRIWEKTNGKKKREKKNQEFQRNFKGKI